MSENERLKQIVELQDLLAEQRKRGDKAEAALATVENLIDRWTRWPATPFAEQVRAAIAQPETEET